jgi:hypothetical protein
MPEVMEPETALSVDDANVTELEERFGDRISREFIERLYGTNVLDLTRKAGGSFMMFVPYVAQKMTKEQLEPMYNERAQASETYAIR